MTSLDNEIVALYKDREELQALSRLVSNHDFKKVIYDGFLSKHPLKLISGKARLNLDEQLNTDIDRQLDCVALFSMYLDSRISDIESIENKIYEAETLRDNQTKGNMQ